MSDNESINNSSSSDSSDFDNTDNKHFRKLTGSITEKIQLAVQLHDRNYFVDMNYNELKVVDERIRP